MFYAKNNLLIFSDMNNLFTLNQNVQRFFLKPDYKKTEK